MTKKKATTILLIVIFVGIIIFIAGDLWSSIITFRNSKIAEKLNNSKDYNNQKRPQLAVSFYPLYFFSKRIGGDKADVFNITPAEYNPHDYRLTSQEIAAIKASQLIVLNGLGLEPWLSDIQNVVDKNNTTILTVSENLSDIQLIKNERDKANSHIWLSPILAQKIVDRILEGFLQIDPRNANYYQANANKLKSELIKLDGEYRKGLENCADKKIVTTHSAFLYLAKDYGLTQIVISGLSPSTNLSSAQSKNMSEFIRVENVKYIFFEEQPTTELAEKIEKSFGVKSLVLTPIETLTTEEIASNKNYFTFMENNLNNLKLQCQ